MIWLGRSSRILLLINYARIFLFGLSKYSIVDTYSVLTCDSAPEKLSSNNAKFSRANYLILNPKPPCTLQFKVSDISIAYLSIYMSLTPVDCGNCVISIKSEFYIFGVARSRETIVMYFKDFPNWIETKGYIDQWRTKHFEEFITLNLSFTWDEHYILNSIELGMLFMYDCGPLSVNYFSCSAYREHKDICISKDLKCDGILHCPFHGNDEKFCYEKVVVTILVGTFIFFIVFLIILALRKSIWKCIQKLFCIRRDSLNKPPASLTNVSSNFVPKPPPSYHSDLKEETKTQACHPPEYASITEIGVLPSFMKKYLNPKSRKKTKSSTSNQDNKSPFDWMKSVLNKSDREQRAPEEGVSGVFSSEYIDDWDANLGTHHTK